MILYRCFAVHSQIIRSCQAPGQQTGNKTESIVHPSCVWHNHCSNDMVPTNAINCSIPISISEPIPGNCHLWGSDGPHQQMLLVYLLRITSNTMALHYFNDSSSSQQNPSRQQLCTANKFDIVKVISESCPNCPPVVLPIEDSECCSNVNISVNFSERWMEIHFLCGFIGIPVYYLSCTSKS